jgi:predicted TIM-barrel fold metal-dependent hydrolase
MFHTGSSIFPGSKIKYGDPMWLDDVAVDFPSMNVLIVHGGRGLWYERAEFLTQLHPNLYLEISGLPPKNLPRYFPNLERIGHKVIFGTDWPANPGIAKNIAAIRELGLSGEVTEAILGGTAARLLGLGG